MAELALGAVNSLLGLLREEAQRLSRVQGDVQFIKEEMESMNSFLLHQANTVPPDGDHDEQVRTWMKQVRDLAFDCSNCIDLYVQRRQGRENPRGVVGLRHCIPWLPWFVRSLVAQHRAASQIRELKERAREVGERRLRYGVEPPKPKADGDEKKQDRPTIGWEVAVRADASAGAGEDDLSNLESSVRFAQDCGHGEMPPILEECTEKLLRWLKDETTFKEWPRVMFIAAPGTRDGRDVARQAVASVESQFECKVWVCTGAWGVMRRDCWDVLRGILRELEIQEDEQLKKARDDYTEEELEEEIREHLQDKRSLIVLDGFSYPGLWEIMQKHLRTLGCAAGSAVIVTTKVDEEEVKQLFAKQLCGKPIVYSLVDFFGRRARPVLGRNYHRLNKYLRKYLPDILREIQERCEPNAFCMKMFVHALYANPNRTKQELNRFRRMLDPECSANVKYSNARRVLTLCYNDLPRAYKACLLYLAIFPRHHQLRRSRLVGRWAVEGFTARQDWPRTVRAAERAFDVLLNRGFVYPSCIGAAGKVKNCVVHHHQLLWELVVELAKEENFVDPRVSHHLAQHFSTQSGLRLRRSDNITKFLVSPAEYSPLYRQLKVLDLEGCQISQQHRCLTNICNILLLRYLSLRNIAVTHLPKEIEHLQQLEVLDIRGTKVPASATRDVLLPKLKRLLAGCIDRSPSSVDTITADESFSTIIMPRRIDKMTNMEVLSHVDAPGDAGQLKGISDLWMLRKLGVVIPESEEHLNEVLKVVSDLNECLRSLSIRIKRTPPGSRGTSHTNICIRPDKLKTSPNLESLSLSGITSGQLLQLFAKDDHSKHLAKVTLHDTRLNRDDLSVVGKLPNLRCLRLRHKSYNEEQLIFTINEFQNLTFLVVEGGSDITAIRFGEGAAPALEKIVWSFTNMEPSLFGLLNLPKVKEIEFNGGPVPSQVYQDIENHENHPVITPDQEHNHREGTGSAAAVP